MACGGWIAYLRKRNVQILRFHDSTRLRLGAASLAACSERDIYEQLESIDVGAEAKRIRSFLFGKALAEMQSANNSRTLFTTVSTRDYWHRG